MQLPQKIPNIPSNFFKYFQCNNFKLKYTFDKFITFIKFLIIEKEMRCFYKN